MEEKDLLQIKISQDAPSTGTTDLSRDTDFRVKDQQRLDSIASSSSGDITDKFLEFTSKQSMFYKALEKIQDIQLSSIKQDDEFIKAKNQDVILNALRENNLPITYYEDIAKSGSQKEMDYRLLNARSKNITDENINNVLSERQKTVGAIASTAPEVIGGFMIGNMYGVSSSLMKVAAIEGAYEASLALTKYTTQEDYTLKDGITDILVGTAISTGAVGIAKRFDSTRSAKDFINDESIDGVKVDYSKFTWSDTKPLTAEEVRLSEVRKNIEKQIEEGKRTQLEFEKQKVGTPEYEAEQARLIEVRRNIRKQMGFNDEQIKELEIKDEIEGTTYGDWKYKKMSEMSEIDSKIASLSIDEVANKEEIDALKSKSVEIRKKLNSNEAKLKEEEDFRIKEQEEVNARNMEEEQHRLNLEKKLDEKFKEDRYSKYAENRKIFFSKQDNIQAEILDSKIKPIKQAISDIQNKLADINKKMSETKSKTWITKYEKQKQALKAELKANESKLSSSLEDKPLTPRERNLKLVVDNMAEDIHNIKDELLGVIKSATKEELEGDLKLLVQELHKKFPKEMEQINSLLKSKLNNKTVSELKASGKFPKAITLAVALAVGANASDGGDTNFGSYLTGIVVAGAVLLAGKNAFRTIRNANIREAFNSVGKKLTNSYNKTSAELSPEAGVVRRVGNFIAEQGYTGITSTVAPFKAKGGRAYDMIKRLLYSKDEGTGAEITKQMWNDSALNTYSSAERIGFAEWRLEKKITGSSSLFDDLNTIGRFRQEVADEMILRTGKSKAISRTVDEFDKVLESVYDRAKEYGVKGFENITYKKGILPRLWNNEGMHNVATKISEKDRARIVDSIANAIAKTSGDTEEARNIAEGMMLGWVKGYHDNVSRSADDIYSVLHGHFKDDASFEEISKTLGIYEDRMARAKFRIDFDHFDIEPIHGVDMDGELVTITRQELIHNDVKTIIDKTVNQLNAHSALAKNGWGSVAELNREIELLASEGYGKKITDNMRDIRDLILGVPVNKTNSDMHVLAMAVKDLTIASKLALVVFSLGTEMINLLATGGMTRSVRALAESIAVSFGKDSQMMKSMSEISGLATSVNRLDFSGFRGTASGYEALDDLSNASKIRNFTMKVRDYSLYLNKLLSATDMFQRAGMQLNTERLAKYLIKGDEGTLTGISKERMGMYGVTKEKLDLLRGKFELNEKGVVKAIDFSTWTQRQKDAYGEILRGMNQTISPETTLGETGLYAHTTDIGKLFSTLSMYPMQQFNIHGLGGLQAMDKLTMVHMFGGFVGTYLGLHARYAVQGKKIDEEKILLYSLMNIPQLGALSYMTSFGSPATIQTISNSMALIGIDKR